MDEQNYFALKVVLNVVGILLMVVGASGVPGDVAIWKRWIERIVAKLDQNRCRWVLVIVGLVIVITAWLPLGKWAEHGFAAKEQITPPATVSKSMDAKELLSSSLHSLGDLVDRMNAGSGKYIGILEEATASETPSSLDVQEVAVATLRKVSNDARHLVDTVFPLMIAKSVGEEERKNYLRYITKLREKPKKSKLSELHDTTLAILAISYIRGMSAGYISLEELQRTMKIEARYEENIAPP